MSAAHCNDDLHIGKAETGDIGGLVALERTAWPDRASMRAARETFARRVAIGGVWIARSAEDGRVLGSLSTFRPRWARSDVLEELITSCPEMLIALPAAVRWRLLCARYGLPANWHAATGDGRLGGGILHDQYGEVVFGVGVATDPRVRGRAVASTLLDAALRDAYQHGARYFAGYSRLPLYHMHPAVELEDYIRSGVQRGGRVVPHDYGFRLHWSLGAQPLRSQTGELVYQGVRGAMRDDPECLGAGVLIITPLAQRTVFPFEELARQHSANRPAARASR
jgi:GNAT superfamily N-acetyltransferase